MARKLQLISELAGRTAREVTRDVDGWKRYLDTASRLYKYTFDDQLLIYAQRPDATACADMDVWNGKMGRWVRAGSKGIALIHESESGRPRLEYVFDGFQNMSGGAGLRRRLTHAMKNGQRNMQG